MGFNDSGLERAKCERRLLMGLRGGGADLIWGNGVGRGNKRKRWCENEVMKHVFLRTNIFLAR